MRRGTVPRRRPGRRHRARLAAGTLALGLLALAAGAQPNPYAPVTDWPELGDFRALGSVSAVAADGQGTVWIAERCGGNSCDGNTDLDPIIALDARSGRVVASFGAGLFVWPHGIHVDSAGNVWVTDGRGNGSMGHQVIKFRPDGRELMRLGEAGIAGDGPTRFNGPTGIVTAADGTIFVSDGHETESNHRIVRFSPEGRYLGEWGGFGTEPGRFNVPHAITIDSEGRLYVADRDNNRIQVFTQDGDFVASMTQFGRPSGVYAGADDILYVSDNQSNAARNPGWTRGIRVGGARSGTVSAFIPDPEFDPAASEETSAHGIAADASGAIYGAEVWSRMIRKYVLAR